MAGKSFKIALNPTFKKVVNIPRIDGGVLEVPFTFKVFDRKGLAKIYSKWAKQNEEMVKVGQEENWELETWAEREIELQVDQVKDIVAGWGFDEQFNDENIEALVSTLTSVTNTIQDAYNEAYTKARSGN